MENVYLMLNSSLDLKSLDNCLVGHSQNEPTFRYVCSVIDGVYLVRIEGDRGCILKRIPEVDYEEITESEFVLISTP
jgi:hypothetical protein